MKKPESSKKKAAIKGKLKHYSALAASVVALDVSAQVVYTDINDTTLVNNGDYFDIDLNNDGIREGRIEFVDYSVTTYSIPFANVRGAEVDSLVNASVNAISSIVSSTTTSTNSIYVAAPLNLNDNIDNGLNNWLSGPTSTGNSSYPLNGVLIGARAMISQGSTSTIDVGQFPGNGDKFLGVRFTIGTVTHYGWMRLDMSANRDSITIKDFAYQSMPNTPILAGDTGVAVGLNEQILENELDYFSADHKIIIKSELASNSILSIYDLSGKLLQSETVGYQNQISIQGNLSGIYIVEIRNSQGVTRKKLWLETN